MSGTAEPTPETRLAEGDARRVLERAIQLDTVRSGEMTVAEVQRVATELGVSHESVARALSELRNEAGAKSSTWRVRLQDRLLGWARSAAIGGAAFLGGTLLGGKNEEVNFWLFAATAAIAIYYRVRGKSEDYVRDIAALWTGFGVGWFFASGMLDEGDTTFHLLVPGLAALVIGWVILKLPWPWRANKSEDVQAIEPAE